MRFEKLKPEAPAPSQYTFPAHRVIPTTPLVFDDTSMAPSLACRDCLHSTHGDISGYHCGHKRSRRFDVVYGWQSAKAADARAEGQPCGPTGSLWAAVPPPTFQDRAWAWVPLLLLVLIVLSTLFIR